MAQGVDFEDNQQKPQAGGVFNLKSSKYWMGEAATATKLCREELVKLVQTDVVVELDSVKAASLSANSFCRVASVKGKRLAQQVSSFLLIACGWPASS
jgi:hypothetical protein